MTVAGRALLPAVVAALLLVPGCGGGGDESTSESYQPSEIHEVDGLGGTQVTFTEDAAARVDLATATAREVDGRTVVPYAALIYDGQGASWVYTSTAPLTFLRAEVAVDRIEDGQVVLASGLRPGVEVVTVGATEVYGAELDIAGGH